MASVLGVGGCLASLQSPHNLRRRFLHEGGGSGGPPCHGLRRRQRRTPSSSQKASSSFFSEEGGGGAHYQLYKVPDEVLFTIFSYLLEQDLCRAAQVCRRFHTISSDAELWKSLYQSVYEYDLPLFHTAHCKFEFVAPEEVDCSNPWKESFRQLYRGIHVQPHFQAQFDGCSRSYFETIDDAVSYCEQVERTVIFVHTGTYRQEVELCIGEAGVALIGAAPGNVAEHVVLETHRLTTVTFVEGARGAYLGYMTLKFTPEITSSVCPYSSCLEIRGNCSPTVDHCIVRSTSVVWAAVWVSGAGAEPCLLNCDISDCENVGLFIEDYAQGTYEENEISRNAKAGVLIKTGSNPTLRRNQIYDGRDVGVCIFNGGKGLLEENDIHGNAKAGVLISTQSHPALLRNRIFNGLDFGVEITINATATLGCNQIFHNHFGGIRLSGWPNVAE